MNLMSGKSGSKRRSLKKANALTGRFVEQAIGDTPGFRVFRHETADSYHQTWTSNIAVDASMTAATIMKKHARYRGPSEIAVAELENTWNGDPRNMRAEDIAFFDLDS